MIIGVSDQILLIIKDCIALLGVAVIIVGALYSAYQLLILVIKKEKNTNYVRLQFGNSVILGLEFMVGADIIGSLIEPDYYSIGLLAILVLVRTVLSYFLNIELAALSPKEKENLS